MTVYELIQKLTEFPAEAKVKVTMYGTVKQIEVYVKDKTTDFPKLNPIIRFDSHIVNIDWKYYGEVIELDCEVDDL